MSYTTNPELTKMLRTAELSARERQRLLNTDRCKTVLDLLAERSTPLKLETLTMEVAAREEDVNPADEEAIERIAISLRYDHLPRMAELGILDYDSEANLIQTDESRRQNGLQANRGGN